MENNQALSEPFGIFIALLVCRSFIYKTHGFTVGDNTSGEAAILKGISLAGGEYLNHVVGNVHSVLEQAQSLCWFYYTKSKDNPTDGNFIPLQNLGISRENFRDEAVALGVRLVDITLSVPWPGGGYYDLHSDS